MSCINQPPFARSPLDGYAICAEDTVGVTKEILMLLNVIILVCMQEEFRKKLCKGERQ